MNYLDLLINSHKSNDENLESDGCRTSRLEYLGAHIFDFTTYDGAMDSLFAQKAVEVIAAVTAKKTFEYIEASEENYKWYLIMVNMPFFQGRLSWGTSIRGAWWDFNQPPVESCGLFVEEKQVTKFTFSNSDEFVSFARALVQFVNEELFNAEVENPDGLVVVTILEKYRKMIDPDEVRKPYMEEELKLIVKGCQRDGRYISSVDAMAAWTLFSSSMNAGWISGAGMAAGHAYKVIQPFLMDKPVVKDFFGKPSEEESENA